MNPTVRNVLAVVGGLFTGGIVIALVERANSRLFPLPPGTDLSSPSPDSVRAALESAPDTAFLGVLVAWALGTFAGALVASKAGVGRPRTRALIVGSFLFLGAVVNMLTLPHPGWFWVVALVLFHPTALFAARVAGRGSAATRTA